MDANCPDVRGKFGNLTIYAGQFHVGFVDIKDRKLTGMDSYVEQAIFIDTERSNIVVVNTIHTDYDWYELVHQAIKNEKISD